MFEEDLEVVYACVQGRREQGAPCAYALVALASYATVERVTCEHNNEPETHGDLVVWHFTNLEDGARMRDALLATRAQIVRLFEIDRPYYSIGASRGVPEVRALRVVGSTHRQKARLFDKHWNEPCDLCGFDGQESLGARYVHALRQPDESLKGFAR